MLESWSALAFEKRRIRWNTNGTSALRAAGPGIALSAKERATAVNAKDALEQEDARTAQEPAANRRRQPVDSWAGLHAAETGLAASPESFRRIARFRLALRVRSAACRARGMDAPKRQDAGRAAEQQTRAP